MAIRDLKSEDVPEILAARQALTPVLKLFIWDQGHPQDPYILNLTKMLCSSILMEKLMT